MTSLAVFHRTSPAEAWRTQQASSSFNSICPLLSRRRRSDMPCSSSRATFVEGTLGCLYAFLQPHQGTSWGKHVSTTVSKGWRNPVDTLRGLKYDTWSSRRTGVGYHHGNKNGMYGRQRRSTNGTRLSTPFVAESESNGKMDKSAAYSPPSLPTPGKRDAGIPGAEGGAAGLNRIGAPVDFDLPVAKVNHRPTLPKNDTMGSGGRGRGDTATTAVAAPTLPLDNNQYEDVDGSPVDDSVTLHLRTSHDDGDRLQSGSRDKWQPPTQPQRFAKREKGSPTELEMRQLGKMRRWRDVLGVLASIPSPSERHYLAAISACDWSGEPWQALRVHGMMVASGISPSPESVLPVVRGLLFSGDASKALRVFQKSGVRLRVRGGGGKTSKMELLRGASAMHRLYATVIRAAHKAGNWREAVLFFREAELLDPGPSAETARTVFLACYAAKQYAAAATFASDALRPPWEDVARRRMLMNKVIVACGRAGPDHYHQALELYEELERTVGADGYTLTAAIDVLRRLGDWRRALPLLDRLVELGVPPDRGLRTSINAVLSAMGPDDYREGLRLVERSAEEWGVEGDVVTYGTLLLAASEQLPPLEALLPSGEGEGEAVRILRLAVAANAVPSESCLNMVMFGLARSGLWEEASAFVEVIEMAGRRVSRNQREALVAALCVGERWREAVSTVETMLGEATVVDNATAGLAMKAFAKMGLRDHWRAALSLMKRSQEASEESMSQNAIDASSWRCLLSGLAMEGLHREAAFVMQEMVDAGIRMDKNSGAALIVAAYATGDYGGALAWMKRLRSAGLPISRNGYAAAVEACCAMGKPEVAIRVLESITEGEAVGRDAHLCLPGVSAYNTVLETLCRCGRPDGALVDSSSRVWKRKDEKSGVFFGMGRSGEVQAPGGVHGLGSGVDSIEGGRRGGIGDTGSGGEGQRERYPSAVERAESAVRLLADMVGRGVSVNGVTYELVISALLEAERVDDIVDLWKQAWSDPGLAPLRQDIAHRVLGVCKKKGRGILTVKLLQIGVRLAGRDDASWAGAGLFREAIEACEREGTEAWSAALALLELWDASDVKKSHHLVHAVAKIVDEAAADGLEEAIKASATLAGRIGGMPPAMSRERPLAKRAGVTGLGEDVANTAGAAESGASS